MSTFEKTYLTHKSTELLAREVAVIILGAYPNGVKVYPIPNAGIPATYIVWAQFQTFAGPGCEYDFQIVATPEEADIFIDDIIDSGDTMMKYCDAHPGKPFYVLVDKLSEKDKWPGWIVFPWESRKDEGSGTESFEPNVVRLLQYVGEDPKRGGLVETPKRVAKAWGQWCSGYGKDPADLLKVFEDGADGCNTMVTVKDLPIYSHCEHHLAPIFGTVTISYIPNGKIVGLSKLARLADMFARRLQVQERLTTQIADALVEHLEPEGVGVMIKARHLCMESRGICQQGHHTITTALRGLMLTEKETRAEFLDMAR